MHLVFRYVENVIGVNYGDIMLAAIAQNSKNTFRMSISHTHTHLTHTRTQIHSCINIYILNFKLKI